MARLAKELGLHVTVADARAAYAKPERFPEADEVVLAGPEDTWPAGSDFQNGGRDHVTPLFDGPRFSQGAAAAQLGYLGLMGPGARARKMLQELRAGGVGKPTRPMLRQIHNPVGLDIGAENPEQIALAILAEIQAVISGHAGGLLREKQSSIHSPAIKA